MILPLEDLAKPGGRVGLKGGADAATASFSKSAGSSRPGRWWICKLVSPRWTNVTYLKNPGGKDEGPVDKSTMVGNKLINQIEKLLKLQPSGLEKDYLKMLVKNLII